MRSVEDKEINTSSTTNFEFPKGGTRAAAAASSQSHQLHRAALGKTKPTPSKWDDAQKWLVGLSRDSNSSSKTSKPRNSNADDTRLIAPVPHQENGYSSGEDHSKDNDLVLPPGSVVEVETKNIDCEESFWRASKSVGNVDTSSLGVRSVCVRDMGTEMTPIASLEPSRAATTHVRRSPIASGASTPIRFQTCRSYNHYGRCEGPLVYSSCSNQIECAIQTREMGRTVAGGWCRARAMAWDEAEHAKYMARSCVLVEA